MAERIWLFKPEQAVRSVRILLALLCDLCEKRTAKTVDVTKSLPRLARENRKPNLCPECAGFLRASGVNVERISHEEVIEIQSVVLD